MNKLRLFIDPASISTGWAIFDGSTYVVSGTIAVDKSVPIFGRLKMICNAYTALNAKFWMIKEVHIEQLVRNTHIHTHWSVGAIGSVFGGKTKADIPIRGWQKYCEWGDKRTRLVPFKKLVKSTDELAAIGMGLYYVKSL